MYRVVTKIKGEGSDWETSFIEEYNDKECADLSIALSRETATSTTGSYAEKYSTEVVLDTPTAVMFHSKLKDDTDYKGITRLIYIEEVA